MNDVTTSTDATEAKVELTLDQKIAQAEARLAKLRQLKLTEINLNNVEKGDKVTIKFGRGDKVRHIEGEVIGVAVPNVVVLAADLETFKVNVRDIIANPSAESRTQVEDNEVSQPVADQIAEVEAANEAAAAGEDPLENA